MGKEYINGKLKETQQDGKTKLDIQQLRQKLNDANGNPQIQAVLEQIIDYFEQEG